MIRGAASQRRPTIRARLRSMVVNPVVRGLLHSPAHRLVSGSVLLLGYTGRCSGRSVELPVQYAVHGDDLVVVAGQPEQKTWWRNFGTDPRPVTVTVRGQRCRGTARRPALDDPDRQRALRAYAGAAPRVPLGATTPVLVVTPLDCGSPPADR